MLKLVPSDLREASYALGIPRWRTITFVVLPTALTGIVTGIMLAIARVMGESAPLLVLASADAITTTRSTSRRRPAAVHLQPATRASRRRSTGVDRRAHP